MAVNVAYISRITAFTLLFSKIGATFLSKNSSVNEAMIYGLSASYELDYSAATLFCSLGNDIDDGIPEKSFYGLDRNLPLQKRTESSLQNMKPQQSPYLLETLQVSQYRKIRKTVMTLK